MNTRLVLYESSTAVGDSLFNRAFNCEVIIAIFLLKKKSVIRTNMESVSNWKNRCDSTTKNFVRHELPDNSTLDNS